MKNIVKKIINTYTGLSLPLKVSLWFFICSFLQKGLSFLTTPIFTRILSTTDYGVVSVYNSWEQIIIIFITMNLANSVFNVGLVRYDNDKNHFQSSMLGLEIVWFLCASIIFLILYPFIEKFIQLPFKYIFVMLVFSFFATVISMWTLRKRLDYDYKSMVIVTILNTAIGIFMSIAFVFTLNDKAFGKIIGGVIVVVLLGIYCTIDFIRKDKKLIDVQYWEFALKYNIPMIPHFLSTVILNQLDRIMIQNMCGLSEAGIYTVGYSSAGVVYIVNQALAASYNPWLLQRLKVKNYNRIKEIVNAIMLLYLAALTVIILFAPEIMRFMATEEYYEGIYIIPPVACSMFFILLFNLFAPVEHFSMKTKFLGIASAISAIANIVLNYIFIELYGYLAAGYTTLVCYIIYAIAHWIYMKKCCRDQGNIQIFDDKFIILMAITVSIIALVSALLYSYFVLRYVFMVVIVAFGIFKRRVIAGIILEMRK